jgi:hypothetical protein
VTTPAFSIYCDESCHLENDGHPAMVLGGVMCPAERVRAVARRVREIKLAHGLPAAFEVKWTKVSPAKAEFYTALVDYFFDQEDLRFRALVVPDKSKLNHAAFDQTHDDFYYKMYYEMLRYLLADRGTFSIYLDIKDTRSLQKTRKLHEVLCSWFRDFERERIAKVALVRSEQVQLVQLADLLIGAVSYANRARSGNAGKVELVRRMEQRSGFPLTTTSSLWSRKVNVFVWRATEGSGRV